MSLKAQRKLINATTKRYQKASKKEKQIILDEFVSATGYHRKYAIHLLNNRPPDRETGKKRPRKPRERKYDENVKTVMDSVGGAHVLTPLRKFGQNLNNA